MRGDGRMLSRLWGIRHLRFFWYARRVDRWAEMWSRAGIGLGVPNESDIRWLDDIWRGRA
jgi:hypothetical protein